VQEADAQQENPPWRKLNYKPLWNRRWFALVWSVGFWGICAALGFCILQSFLPFGTLIRLVCDIAYWVLFAAALFRRRLVRLVKSRH
jgi:hypothetical protein